MLIRSRRYRRNHPRRSVHPLNTTVVAAAAAIQLPSDLRAAKKVDLPQVNQQQKLRTTPKPRGSLRNEAGGGNKLTDTGEVTFCVVLSSMNFTIRISSKEASKR